MSARLNTLFEWCNDVAAMRRFYSDLLGMEETHFRDDERASVVVYQAGETQIVITRAPDPKPVLDDWTKTWGFDAGALHEPAWVVEVDWEDFPSVVERLRSADVPVYGDPREDEELRQLVVRDPMGRTVSVDAHRKRG